MPYLARNDYTRQTHDWEQWHGAGEVCEYLYYHEKNGDSRDVPDMDIPPELCLELLMAADYLNGKYLRQPFVQAYVLTWTV